MQRHRTFQVLLRPRRSLRPGLGGFHLANFLIQQSGECLIGQGPPPLEIPTHNQISLGMAHQPTLSVAQEFINLGVADVIMLLFVQHRQQDIQMRQKIVNRYIGAERQPEVIASAPFGEVFIERDLRCLDRVSEGLK